MKEDARALPTAAQEEKRKLAIRLRKKGHSYREIGEVVGVHELTIGNWVRRYQAGGAKALESKQRGRRTGTGRLLTREEERAIQKLIMDKTPDQLKLSYALWTRKAVKDLIEHETGKVIAIRTVGKYLALWGFTPQKPLKRAYEQNPRQVERWLNEDYPEIEAQARREEGEIHWGDETGLRNDSQHGRGYAPKGKTPVIRLNANRCSTNMISSVTNQGKVRFKVFEGTMNADILIDFMKRLIKGAGRKVFLILDNLRVHHARVVKAWLAEHKNEIEVFYLPSYSPELNPDEYLNCDLKGGVHGGKPARDKGQLKKKVIAHMRMLQKRPSRVRKYFQHPKIRYAA